MATVQSRTHEQVVHQALEVMLQQQLPEAWDVQTLCSLLQVSTACRKAVFDSGVSCELCPQHFAASGSSDPSMQRIMGFASWLPNHAPLVSSLELRTPHYEADTAVVEQLLTMAVKLCAHQQALPAQLRTATGLTQPLAGLRLKSLEGNLLLQPAALTALAAGSHLTRLCWQELRPGTLSAPVLQALGQLTSLKSWEVHGTCSISQQVPPYTVHLAASLANLQKLERLVVHQALEVMLQQPLPEAWDVKTLCSLLQVSTACRKAVFDSGVSCALSPRHFSALDSSAASVLRIMGFASWLPSHAPLVCSLELSAPRTAADTAVAEHLLTLAVKLCAQQQVSPTQALTPTGLIQPLAGLRLQSLTGNMLLQPAALAALASCSHLTNLCWQRPVGLSTPVLHALGHFTGLKVLELHLSAGGLSQQESTHLSASLAKLEQLEAFECMGSGRVALACLPQLPCSLVRLTVAFRASTSADAAGTFDVGHLTNLQQLSVGWLGHGSVATVFPPSLSRLSVIGRPIGAGVQSLPQLDYLDMLVDFSQPSLLQHVHRMPLLRTLVLGLRLVGGKLTDLSEGHAQVIAAALAAATQVTCLEIYRDQADSSLNSWRENDAVLLLRSSLQQMRRLGSLVVEGICLDTKDVLGWTALSALTSLTVAECSGFTDTAVAALACKLPGLQHLEVHKCGLSSPVLWPALACCTGLVHLELRGHSAPLEDETLLYLTSLARLTLLVLHGSNHVALSLAAVQQFRAAMPQLGEWLG